MKSKKSQKKNKKPTICIWCSPEKFVADWALPMYLCKKCEQELNQAEQELQDEQGKGSV